MNSSTAAKDDHSHRISIALAAALLAGFGIATPVVMASSAASEIGVTSATKPANSVSLRKARPRTPRLPKIKFSRFEDQRIVARAHAVGGSKVTFRWNTHTDLGVVKRKVKVRNDWATVTMPKNTATLRVRAKNRKMKPSVWRVIDDAASWVNWREPDYNKPPNKDGFYLWEDENGFSAPRTNDWLFNRCNSPFDYEWEESNPPHEYIIGLTTGGKLTSGGLRVRPGPRDNLVGFGGDAANMEYYTVIYANDNYRWHRFERRQAPVWNGVEYEIWEGRNIWYEDVGTVDRSTVCPAKPRPWIQEGSSGWF